MSLPDVRANRHILGVSWAAITGGFVFGIGAASESRMRYLDSESPWRGRIVDAADDCCEAFWCGDSS
jgi:hypothetical protein